MSTLDTSAGTGNGQRKADDEMAAECAAAFKPLADAAAALAPPRDDGGPAFPTDVGFSGSHKDCFQIGPSTAHFYGMSLRDYFAAAALPHVVRHLAHSTEYDWYTEAGRQSYRIADALLAARKGAK